MLGQLSNEIDSAMKRVRMIPLSGIAPQWRRIVRESSQQVGRPVVLDINVGAIQLDKQILDKLRDPLMHVLRNAVAHGIEDADGRAAAGKPLKARVAIEARLRGIEPEAPLVRAVRGDVDLDLLFPPDAGELDRRARAPESRPHSHEHFETDEWNPPAGMSEEAIEREKAL